MEKTILLRSPRLRDRIGTCPSDSSPGHLLEVSYQSLEQDYGYPKDWLAQNSAAVDTIKNELGEAVVSGLKGLAFGVGESLPYFIFIFEYQGLKATEDNLRVLMAACSWISLGGFTDGTVSGTGFLRRNFYSSKLDHVADIDACLLRSNSTPYISGPAGERTSKTLQPLVSNIENVFFDIHSHLRDIDGLHPDDALDELCKLIYAKIYDEEKAPAGEQLRFQRWIYASTEELAFSLRQLYREACDYDLRVFRLKIPQYDRSRGVFNTPLRLSSTALQRSVETLEAYALSLSDADVKGRAFQKVLDRAVRHGMGQYFTPEPIATLMVTVCAPRISELILDPFCGSAHFLSRSLQEVRAGRAGRDEKLFHEFAFGKLHGIEKSDRMVRIAMTDMRLHGDGHSNIRCTDALADFANFPDIAPESFDVILTNPPFGSLLGAESIERLGRFELAVGRKTVPLEILGLERCVQFLRQGGRMGIVIPDSILSNRNTEYVREWLTRNVKLRAIISLPVEAFAPFGANVKTSILFARKWKAGEIKTSDYSVLLGRVDSLGYDASGRATTESDIGDMMAELMKFIAIEGW